MNWLKWIDIPPMWLLAHLAVTFSFPFGLPRLTLFGAALVCAGVALMVLALLEMRRHRTTPIPHMEAQALVTKGIFAFSRNPIYLGDVLVLAGVSLYLGSLVGANLILVLIWVLHVRFIAPEEARLKARFGADFDAFARQTRRWI